MNITDMYIYCVCAYIGRGCIMRVRFGPGRSKDEMGKYVVAVVQMECYINTAFLYVLDILAARPAISNVCGRATRLHYNS